MPLGLGKIFRESTGNVVGDFWSSEYDRGLTKDGVRDSTFISRFFPWFNMNEYRKPCPSGFKDFSPYENEMREIYSLDNDQVYWYHLESKSVKDKNKFRREHPCNAQEAFLSGGSCFFDLTTLRWYLKKTKEPIQTGILAPDGSFI